MYCFGEAKQALGRLIGFNQVLVTTFRTKLPGRRGTKSKNSVCIVFYINFKKKSEKICSKMVFETNYDKDY